MKLTGEETIAAPPTVVRSALIDPAVLRGLIPGCQSMEGSPDAGYDLIVSRAVGTTELRLTGRIDMEESGEEGFDLVASGSGGGAGGARGRGRIGLRPSDGGTALSWDLDAETEGALSRLPDFAVRLAAARLAEGFVRRFKATVEGVEPPPRKGFLRRLVG